MQIDSLTLADCERYYHEVQQGTLPLPETVDMSAMSRISTAGIQWLLMLRKALRAEGKELHCIYNDEIKARLGIVGLLSPEGTLKEEEHG